MGIHIDLWTQRWWPRVTIGGDHTDPPRDTWRENGHLLTLVHTWKFQLCGYINIHIYIYICTYIYTHISIYIYIQLIDVISNFKITHKRSYIPTKKKVFCLKSLSHLLHLSHKDVCHWVHCQSQAPVRGSAESMVHWKLRALISSQMEVFAKYNIHISYVLWMLMRLIYIYIYDMCVYIYIYTL